MSNTQYMSRWFRICIIYHDSYEYIVFIEYNDDNDYEYS